MERLLAAMRRARHNTLYLNAMYLLFSTLVVAVTGFVFWLVVTRAYPSSAVGLATTLLSVSSLLSLLGLTGFDITFVRFLPHAANKNAYINSGLIVVALVSGTLAIGTAVLLPLWSPNLGLLHQPLLFAGFVFFTVVTALNTLTNAVFLAFKQARYILLVNTLFSLSKIALPLVVYSGSAMTIFTLAGLAQLIGLILSVVWLYKKCGYKFGLALDRRALGEVKKFAFTVYIASVLNLLPPSIVPLLIVHDLPARHAAYYYMAFTVASVLYTIAYSSMQSVFAESSHNEAALKAHVKKAAFLIGVTLVPAAVVAALLSGPLLSLFGAEYAANGAPLLRWFALAAVLVATYSALGAIFKVTKHLPAIVAMNIVYAVVIISLSAWLLPAHGVVAIGWAWLAGNAAACAVGGLFLVTKHNEGGA